MTKDPERNGSKHSPNQSKLQRNKTGVLVSDQNTVLFDSREGTRTASFRVVTRVLS
jgi:hypothetical protein